MDSAHASITIRVSSPGEPSITMSCFGSTLCAARLSKVRCRRRGRLNVGITAERGRTSFFECIDITTVYVSTDGKHIATYKNMVWECIGRILENKFTGLTLQCKEIHRPFLEYRLTASGRFPIRKSSW